MTNEQAQKLLARDGYNKLDEPNLRIRITLFFKYFYTNFGVLFLSGAVAFLLAILSLVDLFHKPTFNYEITVPSCLLMILALVNFNKNLSIIKKNKNEIIKNATVTREGKQMKINVKELVVGDVVHVNSGDVISADMRIIDSNVFKVDNSPLTGETMHIRRIENEQETSSNQFEASNIIFEGTYAVEGSCKAVVIRTGERTLLGALSKTFTSYPTTKSLIGHFLGILKEFLCFYLFKLMLF